MADSLQPMRIFVSVVQNGGLSSAGRQLGLSPASVSRHISVEEVPGHAEVARLVVASRLLDLDDVGPEIAKGPQSAPKRRTTSTELTRSSWLE
jgi:Bacterial regulatory helix-turn-helix protein, lysR family